MTTRKPQRPRRFYQEVAVAPVGGRFGVELDGRPVKTPGGKPLAVVEREIADALAAEWEAQETEIVPESMHLTRLVNTAIERVAEAMDPVRRDVAAYAGHDLLCYRAGEPESLVDRQRTLWDPPLAWAEARLGVRFQLAEGVIAVDQPPRLETAVLSEIGDLDAQKLAGLHQVTTISGSAILALALARGALADDAVWSAAHVDEDHQMAVWGEDEEALERRARRRAEFDAAALVLAAASPGSNPSTGRSMTA